MTVLLYVTAYVCVVVFVAAVVIRGLRVLRMPVHLRWEIYPVAHEKGRAHYGGSYFEELDWWTKPRGRAWISEALAMGAEILLLKGVWEHNRRLWWRSYPFHLGLYLLVGFLGLLVLGAILQIAGLCPVDGGCPVAAAVDVLMRVFGIAGLVLTVLGTALMLLWRLTDADVRDYTKPAHLINLVFILAASGVALVAVASRQDGFGDLRQFLCHLITLKTAQPVGGALLGAAIVLGCLLIAYIPLTHMAHFFLKYFTWHQIRWNDEPNLPGGKLEGQIQERLGQPVSWSAPHIGADGRKNWVDLALGGMPEEEKEEK